MGLVCKNFDNSRIGLVYRKIIHFGSGHSAEVLQRSENAIQLSNGSLSELFPFELNLQTGVFRDTNGQ